MKFRIEKDTKVGTIDLSEVAALGVGAQLIALDQLMHSDVLGCGQHSQIYIRQCPRDVNCPGKYLTHSVGI